MHYYKYACGNHLKQESKAAVPEEGSVSDDSATWETLHCKSHLNLGAFHFNQFNFFMRVFI